MPCMYISYKYLCMNNYLKNILKFYLQIFLNNAKNSSYYYNAYLMLRKLH